MRKLSILLMLIIPAVAFAQSTPDFNNQSFLSSNNTSLFDPSRISMSQSYTFSYYTGNSQSGTLGYYLNSIEYAVSNPLKIRVDIGYLHSPSNMIAKNASASNSGILIPGISIDWRPSDNFRFNVDIRQVPTSNNIYGRNQNYDQWEDYR